MKLYKKKSISLHKLKHEWYELGLSFQFAIIIGILLLTELIFSIFYEPMSHSPSIDVISRTSFSSILGYLLGMNSITPSKKDTDETPHLQTQIEQHSPPIKNKDFYLKGTRVRIIFAGFICITCIITLFFANLTNHLTYTEGITQIGHLISTTIGFLISGINQRS